jgi:hypothetical protein
MCLGEERVVGDEASLTTKALFFQQQEGS